MTVLEINKKELYLFIYQRERLEKIEIKIEH